MMLLLMVIFQFCMFCIVFLSPVFFIVFLALFFLFRRICKKHMEKYPEDLYLGWRWNCMLACGFLAGLNLVITIGNLLQFLFERFSGS